MYPYGKSYGTNAVYNAAEDYRYGFNGMEKEKNMDASGDITDFGARVFDANFPVFGSPDPQSYNFPYISVYAFGNNNPIASIDPDGEATLFINGWFTSGDVGLFGEGSGGKKEYWGSFADDFISRTGDKNAFYIDGSLGGTGNTVSHALDGGSQYATVGNYLGPYVKYAAAAIIILDESNVNSEVRRDAGYEWALANGEDIINSLRTDADGNIIESINVVGHSMGVGFGRGVIAGLIMVANRMHKKLIFETLLDIETFQANKFNVPQKSGKISMENIFENNFSKVAGDNGSWVPSVGHTHGSSPAGLYPDASHGIDDFDAFGIKATKYTAGNEQKKSEYGNNNVKGK